MNTMLCSVSSYWDAKQEAWIVTVTSTITIFPYRKYKISACDEFVAPMAIMEMHGYNALKALGQEGSDWSIEDIT